MFLWPFDKYPGTDYETFNWEWVIGKLKKLKDSVAAAKESELKAAESEENAKASEIAAAKSVEEARYLWVTPEMYGAVGDGLTDDTQAVQDALDSGNNVYFKSLYCITSHLEITKPINISATPNARSGIQNVGLCVHASYTDSNVIEVKSTSVNISGLYIDAGGSANGIYFNNSKYHMSFENMQIYNCIFGFLGNSNWDMTFNNVVIVNATDGFNFAGTVTSTTWNSCVVYNSGMGWRFRGGVIYTVLNSCGTDHTTTGLRCEGSGELTVNNFGVEDFSNGISITSGNNVIVNGFFSTNRTGAGYLITGTGSARCYGCNFAENRFSIDDIQFFGCENAPWNNLVSKTPIQNSPITIISREFTQTNYNYSGYKCIFFMQYPTNEMYTFYGSNSVDNAYFTFSNNVFTPKQNLIGVMMLVKTLT